MQNSKFFRTLALSLITFSVATGANAQPSAKKSTIYTINCSGGTPYKKEVNLTVLANNEFKPFFGFPKLSLINAKVGNYELLKDGKIVTNQPASINEVSKLEQPTHLTAKFTASLQDYSDNIDYMVVFQEKDYESGPGYEAILFSTFHSSDGDSRIHPSLDTLPCTLTKK